MRRKPALVLQLHSTDGADATFPFAEVPLVLHASEVTEEGTVAELAALVRPDAFVPVDVEGQTGVVQEGGRADRTADVLLVGRTFRLAAHFVHVHSVLAVEIPSTDVARADGDFVVVHFQEQGLFSRRGLFPARGDYFFIHAGHVLIESGIRQFVYHRWSYFRWFLFPGIRYFGLCSQKIQRNHLILGTDFSGA